MVTIYPPPVGMYHAPYMAPPPAELCIPMNSAQFVLSISEELAGTEAHLTVEFLSEVVAGFQHYTVPHKQLCLAYMSPWIPNLAHFVYNESLPEQEKVMRLINLLVALTMSETEVRLGLCLYLPDVKLPFVFMCDVPTHLNRCTHLFKHMCGPGWGRSQTLPKRCSTTLSR